MMPVSDSRNGGLSFPGASRGDGEIRFDTWERTVAFSQRFGGRFGVRKAPSRHGGLSFPGASWGGGGSRFDTWERTVAFSQRFGGRFGVRKAPGRPWRCLFEIPETGG